MSQLKDLYQYCYDGFVPASELECCLTDYSVLLCGEVYHDKRLLYAHVFIGISTLFHALHSLPAYYAICERNTEHCTTFISLAIGGALSYGFQILLWPFTFTRVAYWRTVRAVYTGAQIWGGGILGWANTVFNTGLIVIGYGLVTADFEVPGPVPGGGVHLLAVVLSLLKAMFQFGTEYLMLIAGREARRQQESNYIRWRVGLAFEPCLMYSGSNYYVWPHMLKRGERIWMIKYLRFMLLKSDFAISFRSALVTMKFIPHTKAIF